MRKMDSRKYLKLLFVVCAVILLCSGSLYAKRDESGQLLEQVDFISELIDKSGDRWRWSHTARVDFAQTALENATIIGNESLRMKAMFSLAELHFHEGKFETALAYFDTLLHYGEQIKDHDLVARSKIYQGSIYRYRGDLYKALGLSYDAWQEVGERNQASLKALASNHLGVIYRNLGDTEMAMSHYRDALASALLYNDTTQIIQSYINMGNLHWFKREPDTALNFYHQGMELAHKNRDLQHISNLTNNIANTFRDQGQYEKALELYFQALAQQDEVYMVGLKMIIMRNIGITYQRMGELDNAFNYVNKSMDLSKELNLLQFIRDNHYLLSELYSQRKDYDQAWVHLNEYSKLNQQVFNDQLLNSIAYFNERVFDARQKEELYRFRLERNLLILILVILALVFLISFTALTFYRFKEKRAHILSLQETIQEKENTERALRRSEENYQTLIKTLNEGLVVLGINNEIEFANLKACKLFGVDEKKDLQGRNFETFLLTPEDERLFQDKMELQKMGISDHYEVKMKNMAGDVMWVNLSSAPILDENLKAKGSVTLVTDVSERKKSEETYGELTASLNQKIKQLNCLYDISDISGVPGITFGEIIEKSLEIIPVGLKYSHDIAVEIVFEDMLYHSTNYRETPWAYQVPIKVQKRKLGHIQVVYLEEKPLINKDPFHFNEKILLKNISEKFGQILEAKNTDRVLRENQERLEEIQSLARIGNWEKHHLVGEVVFSDTLFEIAGISHERRRFFDIDKMLEMVHPDDKSIFRELISEAGTGNESGQSFSANFRMVTPDGSICHIFSGRKRFFDTDGKLVRTVFTLQDVTRQKVAQELQYSAEVALKTFQAKQQVLADMSFDMRTPVNGIMGVVDFLLQTKLSKEQINLVSTLKESGQDLTGIINKIADLTQASTRFRANHQNADVKALMGRVDELFAVISKQKELKLKISIDKKLPAQIVTDQERIIQVVSNLLSGSVSRNTQGQVLLSLTLESVFNDELAIMAEISDPVPKATKKSTARTRKPISDTEPPREEDIRKYEQSLAISQKLAEILGGSLIIEESPEGTRKASFTFMARMPEENRKSGKSLFSEQTRKHMEQIAGSRVLCVEDRSINQKVLALMLSHAGCKVSMANNGSEAIGLMKTNVYDLVLLDMVMPVMDGMETLKVMQHEFSDIPPVIAVTARTDNADRQLYLSAGAADFIAKPVNAAELYQKMAHWYSRRVSEIVANSRIQ